MRKIICDRCGAEIPNGTRIGYVAVNWKAASDNSLMQDNPYENADFCEKCMEDIARVIDFKILSAPEEEEPDQEEEEVVERIQSTPAKVAAPPDFGKIRQRFALLFRQFIEYQMIRRTAVKVVLKAVHADAVQNKNHCDDRDRCCNADDRKGGLPFLRLDVAGSKQAFISHCCPPPPARNCPRPI